jgi:hypothetical protein
MNTHETEEYKLLKNWFGDKDCKAILTGERRRSWADDSKQLEVMIKWNAADEAGKEKYRQGWRDGIAARARKAEEQKAADQAAATQAAVDAVAAEKAMRSAPSAFADIPGLELSKLCAGTHPLPEFWEKYWTEEKKDRTRHMLANAGLGLRKVKSPANHVAKSITRYELAPRKKNAAEKLMELAPLPSGKNWQQMSEEEREMKVEADKGSFKSAGVTSAEIKGVSARHLYEVCYCSRRESEVMEYTFRREGVLPLDAKLQSSFVEKTGITSVDELNELPLNILKAVVLAYSGGSVARYWEGRNNSSDMAEEMRVWASEGFKPSRAPFFVNI